MRKSATAGKEVKQNPPINGEEEFVFHFDFSSVDAKALYDDPIVEVFREQIANLLDIVVLMEGEKQVKIDGFKFLNDVQVIYKIFQAGKVSGT
jgi:hypothetical protein